MNSNDINGKSCSKVMMTLSQSTGTWLNGCLQPQQYYVLLKLNDPEGKLVAEVGLSYEQAARMLLYSGEVDCTLQRYRNREGVLVEEVVTPPETVRERMGKRLADVEGSLAQRLSDVQKDLYAMINGHVKPGKANLEEMRENINTVLSHLSSNRDYVVQETEKELAAMQNNMAGQLGLFLQAHTGVDFPQEALKQLLPVANSPLLIGEMIDPVVDSYEPKERKPVPIEEMTAMEVADAINARLKAIEKAQTNRGDKDAILYYAGASHTSKGQVTITYINYQGKSVVELDSAKEYLKFLRGVKKVSQFNTHHWFDKQ